ncbi:MAG: FUSC family protein [Trebonia sp.]
MRRGGVAGSLAAALRGARQRATEAGWSVVLTPVAAGLAWYIAHTLLGHHQPFFAPTAPTAAAVSLSKNRVLRGQRALQLMAGVVLGIVIGTVVKAVAGPVPGGSGAVAIGVAAALALAAALVLGGGFFEQGVLFVNQSATSAILMIAVAGAATGSARLSDALIGAGVTLVITVILFPAAPLPLIEDAVREVFGALRDTLARLAELAGAGEMPGPEWAMAAGQRIQGQLTGLQQARSSALQVVSLAPRRWPQRSRVRLAGEQTAPLELLAATVLSLARRVTLAS